MTDPQPPPNARAKPPMPPEALRMQAAGTRPGEDLVSVTVAVVAVRGALHLERCLAALAAQRGTPPFEVVVAYDPALAGIEALCARFAARALASPDRRTPSELAAHAVSEAAGDLILLTEDRCVPRPDWVHALRAAQHPGRAVVGGRVEVRAAASTLDWAFHFVEFFRYVEPLDTGPGASLSLCNASYKRAELAVLRAHWEPRFHEPAIHALLHQRFGDLWREPRAVVELQRQATFAAAVRERYAFGRLFGCTRLAFCGLGRRLAYCALAPGLPLLLLGRMTHKALASPRLRAGFGRSFAALVALVLAWSLGEWLGYLTRREPRALFVAPEVER